MKDVKKDDSPKRIYNCKLCKDIPKIKIDESNMDVEVSGRCSKKFFKPVKSDKFTMEDFVKELDKPEEKNHCEYPYYNEKKKCLEFSINYFLNVDKNESIFCRRVLLVHYARFL